MAVERKRPIQKPLSPEEAWRRLEKVPSGQSDSRKLRDTCVGEAMRLLNDPNCIGKRRRYRNFLLEVLRICGPLCVILCAIGMGQAHVANMKTSDRKALVSLIHNRRTRLGLETFQHLVPPALKDIHGGMVSRKPPERGPDEYSRFKMAKLGRISGFFPPRLCEAINESTIRAWERAKDPEVLATEGVRAEIAWTGNYDGVMFLDIGYAQEIANELFPSEARDVSSCVTDCFAHIVLKGASVAAISRVFGKNISDAIDESELRKWEKAQGQLDATDCVEMIVREEASHHAILKLRIGWKRCIGIINSLYG